MLKTALTVLQVFSAIAIVGLVLIQRGKGADAGAGFGAGASGTVFGARGATTGLSRATAVFAAVFMLNSLLLTYLFQREVRETKSILDEVPAQSAPATPAAVPQPVAPDSGASAPLDAVPQPAPQSAPQP